MTSQMVQRSEISFGMPSSKKGLAYWFSRRKITKEGHADPTLFDFSESGEYETRDQ
jgi:hypothetical protein